MKFITDSNLGKLAKWLRILGYDTVFYRGAIDRNFLRKGADEGRVVLTRRRDMADRNFSGRKVVIYSDRLPGQLREIVDQLDLSMDETKMLSRCLICNSQLTEVDKSGLKDTVPSYVYKTQEHFLKCLQCERIYWSGTHMEKAKNFLQSIITAF